MSKSVQKPQSRKPSLAHPFPTLPFPWVLPWNPSLTQHYTTLQLSRGTDLLRRWWWWRQIPRSDDLPSGGTEPDPRPNPVLTVPAQIPVLVHVPTAVAGPQSTTTALFFEEPGRRSSGCGFCRFLRLFPFLLAEAVEFHFAGEEGRWFGKGRWLLDWCWCC